MCLLHNVTDMKNLYTALRVLWESKKALYKNQSIHHVNCTLLHQQPDVVNSAAGLSEFF